MGILVNTEMPKAKKQAFQYLLKWAYGAYINDGAYNRNIGVCFAGFSKNSTSPTLVKGPKFRVYEHP